MAKQEAAATMSVTTCDFPQCGETCVVFYENDGFSRTDQPEGWRDVLLRENDHFTLCPKHAQYAETVKLVHAMQQRAQLVSESG